MSDATIDVIIPVRNGAATIGRALQSVLAQTALPNRVIVVDDGSDDGTPEVIGRCHDARISLITTAPMGVSHARNRGIEESTAALIALLDSDDYWHPEKLSQQSEVIKRNPRAAVVYCGHAFVNPDLRLQREIRPLLRGRIQQQLLAGQLAARCSTALVRRDAIIQAGGFDETLSFGEDRDLFLRLARNHEFDFTPDVLAFLVSCPDSVTRRPRAPNEVVEIVLQQFDIWRRHLPDPLPPLNLRKLRGNIVQLTPSQNALPFLREVGRILRQNRAEAFDVLYPHGAVYRHWVYLKAARFLRRILPIEIADLLRRSGRRRRDSSVIPAPDDDESGHVKGDDLIRVMQ